MGWSIITSVVDMDKSSIDNRHGLEEVGKDLAEIMTILEGRGGREDNVDLDDELVTGVVGPQVLNLANGSGEAHGQVEKQITFVGLGREPCEVADVMGRGLTPVEDDDQGEEETTDGVEPPDFAIEPDDGEENGARVEDNIRLGIFGQGSDTRVSDKTTPDPACSLYHDGGNHDGNSRNTQFENRSVRTHESLDALQTDLAKGSNHNDGEDENTKRLKPSSSDRIAILVLMTRRDEASGDPDDNGTEEIENGVDQTGKHRHGRDRKDDSKLSSKKNAVCDKVDPDGERHDRIVAIDISVL